MFNISAGGGGTPNSAKSASRFAGTSGKFSSSGSSSGSSWQDRIRDAMINGTGSYRDIDNAFSAGGHNGNGSPHSALVNSGKSKNSSKSKSRGSRGSGGIGGSGGSGDFGGATAPSAKQSLDYYEAPITEVYGFNKETAYQEALANTAYRREMNDMRKAGLNPSVIYGSHNSSGADGHIIPRSDSGYGGSGGSGGSGRRSRGSGNSGKYVFSGGAYYGIMSVVGAATALATGNVGAGMAAAGLAGTAMKALNGFFKK